MTIILDPETDQAIPTIAWPFLISGTTGLLKIDLKSC